MPDRVRARVVTRLLGARGAHMRAVVVHEFGPFEDLAIEDFPTPEPGPHEVLLEIHATAANFVDLLVIAGQYQFLPDLPFVPGKLPAGVVVEVGASVRDLKVGDRVLAMTEQGGYGECVAVPGPPCVKLPHR